MSRATMHPDILDAPKHRTFHAFAAESILSDRHARVDELARAQVHATLAVYYSSLIRREG